MQPQQRLREKKNAEVKRALYGAAMELFRNQGFDRTTVDEIAARAGFSRATFFNHFGTKEGVLRFYGQGLQYLIDGIIHDSQVVAPLEVIRRLLLALVREAEARREEVKLIFTWSVRDPEYLFGQTPARKRVQEALGELVARAQERQEVRRDIPASELVMHLLFIYQGVVFAIITGAGGAEPLFDSAWRFILGGITDGRSPAC